MAFRILVVDDDEAVRQALSESIHTKLQCEVHEAAEPVEARRLLDEYSYALVITDLSFSKGKLEGLSLVERLAALPVRPGIVAFSGYEIASSLAAARGADAFLRKPVQLAELIFTLRQVLDQRKSTVQPAPAASAELHFDEILKSGGTQVFVQPIYEIGDAFPSIKAVEFLTRGPAGSPFERPDVLFARAREAHKESVLDRLCIQRALDASAGIPESIRLSLNVHAATLCAPPDFATWLLETATHARIQVHRITVEIVEHAPIWNQDDFRQTLIRLRGMGVKIALDDIGLGNSNFQMIIDARPDCFKLDRQFVHGCSTNADCRAIIGAIARIATAFGATVIAEGVATEEDLLALDALGITQAQGFLFCPPMPLAEGWENLLAHVPDPSPRQVETTAQNESDESALDGVEESDEEPGPGSASRYIN